VFTVNDDTGPQYTLNALGYSPNVHFSCASNRISAHATAPGELTVSRDDELIGQDVPFQDEENSVPDFPVFSFRGRMLAYCEAAALFLCQDN